MSRLTLATVCRILFGEDLGQALPVVQRTFGPMGDAVRRRALAGGRVPRGWPTPVNQRLRRAQRELRRVCDQIVAHRRASGDRQEDLLGLLLDTQDQGNSLADGEIRDQVLVFLLAGHETTSTALTYTLHLLGRHPDVPHRVRTEVDTIAGDRVLTAQNVSALGYTTMVLKEAMRLYPSAPFLGRQAVQDDQIGGYHVPAGADVVLAPWITHRHPAFWEQPERFDPQRFTPEQEKARHRYAWFPFGGGPRACIGQPLDARIGDRARRTGTGLPVRGATRRARVHQSHHAAADPRSTQPRHGPVGTTSSSADGLSADRERFPEDYEKLSKEPAFLILRLLKPTRPDPQPSELTRLAHVSLPGPAARGAHIWSCAPQGGKAAP